MADSLVEFPSELGSERAGGSTTQVVDPVSRTSQAFERSAARKMRAETGWYRVSDD